jgi:hypothetical protein
MTGEGEAKSGERRLSETRGPSRGFGTRSGDHRVVSRPSRLHNVGWAGGDVHAMVTRPGAEPTTRASRLTQSPLATLCLALTSHWFERPPVRRRRAAARSRS